VAWVGRARPELASGDVIRDRYIYYTFEIGCKGNGFRQIGGVAGSFVVADDIEVGFKNKLPLWVFGFVN
jgi:hypothetical protein